MDNRHNLSDESAPWGNNVTQRVDNALREVDRLEQDYRQLTKQGNSALSRLTAGGGSFSQVISYDLYDQEYDEFFKAFLTPVPPPSGATTLTVRFNNYEYLSGTSSTGGFLDLSVSSLWDNFGPMWEVAPGGEPIGTVGRFSVTVPVVSKGFGEWDTYLSVIYTPHIGNESPPNYRHNVHLIWGF